MSTASLDVLLVEDDVDIAVELEAVLVDAGHRVEVVYDGAEAKALTQRRVFDLVISDVRLPGVDGLMLFAWLREHAPTTAVILMSAFGTVPEAVTAMREHASLYLRKPFAIEHLLAAVREVAWRLPPRSDAGVEQEDVPGPRLIGNSPVMTAVRRRVAAIASSEAPVLITGESGTGKELVARSIHAQSARAEGAFVAINCSAFPEGLLEAELFGYERGAFTGAVHRRQGRFLAADGGTLFLDEVSELAPTAQAKLLRVLESGHFQQLGSDRDAEVNVRVVSACNADLEARMAQGSFRPDLYYRLKVAQVRLPALRHHREDLPELIHHFLAARSAAGAAPLRITSRAWAALYSYDYPGNVRELEHALWHATLLTSDRVIDVGHLPDELCPSDPWPGEWTSSSEPGNLGAAVAAFERAYILRALAETDHSRKDAAAMLGISRKNLWEKMRKYDVDTGEIPRIPSELTRDDK